MLAFETSKLTKLFSRKKITALYEVSLAVEQKIIFGLLGPNGAGKTTLIKILLGILFPTSGSATVLGKPINDVQVKEKIGYLPENHNYPDFLTGGQILDSYGGLAGVRKQSREESKAALLDLVEMQEWEHTKIKKYSKGMRQRLGLAQAMINDPQLLFLDEPTDGVDPIGRKHIRDILIHLKEQGKTIFLNSHLLSEVEMICDQVAILDKGRLIHTGTVADLTSPTKTYRFETSKLSEDVAQGIKPLTIKMEP
ncbi:MAG TPA: ABC transporter ATP-binding protein, partial [bacterium]